MAFTGTPVVKQIADNKVRITGISLANGANGTIGLHGATGSPPGVTLPEAFKTMHYDYDGVNVPFQDAISLTINLTAGTGGLPVQAKSGTTVGDFRITLTDSGSAHPGLDLIVTFH